jgi:cytochrome c oxidase subunit 2
MTLLHPRSAVPTKYVSALTPAICALSACDGPQSTLVPAGRDAEQIADLFNVMMAGSLVIWIAVVAAAIYAVRVGASHSRRAASLFIIGGGVVAPTLVLGALIAYGMPLLPTVLSPGSAGGFTIRVTAKQWWWRIEYLTPSGPIVTANELRLPVDERVELQLQSPDVIHSFWVPSLAGKMDMIPGRLTRLALEPTEVGTFRGACAEYCGASHALMAFSVVVMEPDAFRAWLEGQARGARPPPDAITQRGEALFLANGCAACHTIRGTPAAGPIGPDLTHVGSRGRIAAETLPNDRDALVRWIGQPDRIKPGVHMPAFRTFDPEALTALAAYLDSLQ